MVLSQESRSSAEPILYAVEGELLVNADSAANVNVAFHPLDGDKNKFCPVGLTDNEGKFRLTTRSSGDGAPAGEYSVTFYWPNGPIDECECPDPNLHDRFKGLYADPKNLLYQVKVNSSGNSFKFKAWRPPDEARHPWSERGHSKD